MLITTVKTKTTEHDFVSSSTSRYGDLATCL